MRFLGRTQLLATALVAGLLLVATAVPATAGAAPSHRAKHAKIGIGVAKRVDPAHRKRGPRSVHPASEKGGSGGGRNESKAAGKATSRAASAPLPPPPAAATPAPPAGNIIFSSGFDGSFGGFYVQSLPTRATIATAHPFAGSGNARFEVRQGDVEPDTGSQRSEVTGPTFNNGEEIYVRDEIRVPEGNSFQGTWQLINQLHETNWGGSPGIATFLDPSRRISFGAGDGSPMYWRGPQLEPERWYDFVYHVKLSRDPSQGFAEVWLDGVPQVLSNGLTRMSGETIQTNQTYFKAGIYRSSASTGVSLIEHDDIVIGTSLASVMSF